MRYTKKPVTIEAVRFIGLTDFGDPVFDDAGGLPEWLMEALAGPEGDAGSIWVDVDVIDGKKNLAFGYALDAMPSDVMKSAVPAEHWIVRHENGKLSAWDNELFASLYDAADDYPGPATGSTEALTSALAETAVEHPSDLPNGSVDRLRTAAKPFVIGQGFSDTVGDSDGDDGA